MRLGRIYTLLLLGGVLYGCLSVWLACCVAQIFFFFADGLFVLSITGSRVLKSPTVMVNVVSSFNSVQFCFMYFGALLV